MKDRVEVVEIVSDLEQIVWRFLFIHSFSKSRFVLTDWFHETRETKRHKFRSHQSQKTRWTYCASNRRYNAIPMPKIPDHIAAEARRLFADSIVISKDEMS